MSQVTENIHILKLKVTVPFPRRQTLGTLRKHDADGNENVNKEEA